MNTMALFRRCRVNHALTVQLFSQLFHFISAWLFNHLMSSEVDAQRLRSHYWGATLRHRLSVMEGWAERQGLELAAHCHLGHIVQVSPLLNLHVKIFGQIRLRLVLIIRTASMRTLLHLKKHFLSISLFSSNVTNFNRCSNVIWLSWLCKNPLGASLTEASLYELWVCWSLADSVSGFYSPRLRTFTRRDVKILLHVGCFQATTLLTMSKYSMRDAADVQATCFKLNSLQLQTLLAGYLYANNEPHISPVSTCVCIHSLSAHFKELMYASSSL